MEMAIGHRASEDRALAGAADEAISRDRSLRDDKRAAPGGPAEEGRQLPSRFGRRNPLSHLDTVSLEVPESATPHLRVAIARGRDNAFDARRSDALDARARAARV
jgi:hypothetical protein